jgi:hypothetical protein
MVSRKQEPEKNCKHCRIPLKRRRYGKRLEDMGAFLRREYCSLTCANSKPEPLTKHGYSYHARKHLKEQCEACGTMSSLHAHHINQIKSDNSPNNIQTLCKHCHDYWHSTQRRLGWPIAGSMPSLVAGRKESPEWLMGFPLGWTVLSHSEMQLSLKSPNSSDEA